MALGEFTILSEFWSDDGRRRADVILMEVKDGSKSMFARFYQDEVSVGFESYPTHSEHYYEDAAENFVLGVKNFD